jgi:SpoVK/Ycf46/Vps4 family AAA+-type ATPase
MKTIDTVLQEYLQAAVPSVALRTSEEPRALKTLLAVAESLDLNLNVWTSHEGIVLTRAATSGAWSVPKADEVGFPAGAARAVLASLPADGVTERPGILVFCDLQTWIKDPAFDPPSERVFRELVARASSAGLFVVFLGPSFVPPASFERYVTVLDYSLPDREALGAILDKVARDAESNGLKLAGLDNGKREALLRAAAGLTCAEAETALALAVIRAKDPAKPKAVRTLDPQVIASEKALAIKRSGHLEIIEPDPRGLDAVGGLSELKTWLNERKRAYTPAARKYGLPSPRGCLVVGQPGCGKSLVAKCVGAVLGIPTLRLDLGKLFGSLVGQSESRTDEVLSMVDAVAPCVLWLDEVEKALAGTHGGASHDSGVGARILGKLLYWQQERQSDVFILATCNEPWLLPAPFTRRGRFDETFYVGLPSAVELAEIARVHLVRLGRDARKFNLSKIAAACEGFTGAEVEEAVKAALYRAFYDGEREPTEADVLATAKATKRLCETMAEQFKRMDEYGSRCRPASSERERPGKAEAVRRMLGN